MNVERDQLKDNIIIRTDYMNKNVHNNIIEIGAGILDSLGTQMSNIVIIF